MKKEKIIFIFAVLIYFCANAYADHNFVNGYYKSNGTYVKSHMRTSPNSTKIDNFSSKGNSNPYTWKAGKVNPYKTTNYGYKTNKTKIEF